MCSHRTQSLQTDRRKMFITHKALEKYKRLWYVTLSQHKVLIGSYTELVLDGLQSILSVNYLIYLSDVIKLQFLQITILHIIYILHTILLSI